MGNETHNDFVRRHTDAEGNRIKCRHCQKRKAIRPRGLCWGCYYRPGVRDLYPSTSKFARKGVGQRNSRWGKDAPTEADPGSEEKLLTLERRAAQGLGLFQEGDSLKINEPDVSRGRISDVVYRSTERDYLREEC